MSRGSEGESFLFKSLDFLHSLSLEESGDSRFFGSTHVFRRGGLLSATHKELSWDLNEIRGRIPWGLESRVLLAEG